MLRLRPELLLSPLGVAIGVWGAFLLERPWQRAILGLLLLLGWWSLPPSRRFAPPAEGLLALLLPVALSLPTAFDWQWAAALLPLFLLAPLLFAWGVAFPLSQGQRHVFAVLVAAASLVALAQASGKLAAAGQGLQVLPESLATTATARLATGRAFGTLPLPGHFAALQALAVPFLVSWALRRRVLPVLLLLLSLAGTLATRSLLGVALWLGAFLACLPLHLPRRWRVTLLLLALSAFGVTALKRGDLMELEPLALRWVNWKVAWWSFLQHPWLGVGPGGVGMAGLTSPWGATNITPFAHNTPLQLLAELGIAGLPLLLLGAGSLLRLLGSLWDADRPLAVAVVVGLAHNLSDFSFYEPGFLFPWLLLVATGVAETRATRLRRLPSALVVGLAAPAVLLAALEGRCQAQAVAARQQTTPAAKAAGLLEAAAWAPWRVAEVLEAAGYAVQSNDSLLQQRVLEQLEARSWVAPPSATLAEVRALLLLSLGRRTEAWAWAAEARRRAPFRLELAQLEARCRP